MPISRWGDGDDEDVAENVDKDEHDESRSIPLLTSSCPLFIPRL